MLDGLPVMARLAGDAIEMLHTVVSNWLSDPGAAVGCALIPRARLPRPAWVLGIH
jgi:hypothetical protein